jgi:hypothetical protein
VIVFKKWSPAVGHINDLEAFHPLGPITDRGTDRFALLRGLTRATLKPNPPIATRQPIMNGSRCSVEANGHMDVCFCTNR